MLFLLLGISAENVDCFLFTPTPFPPLLLSLSVPLRLHQMAALEFIVVLQGFMSNVSERAPLRGTAAPVQSPG